MKLRASLYTFPKANRWLEFSKKTKICKVNPFKPKKKNPSYEEYECKCLRCDKYDECMRVRRVWRMRRVQGVWVQMSVKSACEYDECMSVRQVRVLPESSFLPCQWQHNTIKFGQNILYKLTIYKISQPTTLNWMQKPF